MRPPRLHLLLLPFLLASCAPVLQAEMTRQAALHTVPAAAVQANALGLPAQGVASWYGPGFAGRRTANGEIFDPSQLTAAHKTLPFGTLVRVTNLRNGASVVVRINDRGPFKPGRIIDLSKEAARRIGMLGSGTAQVRLDLLSVAGAPLWRAASSGALAGYQVVSRFHKKGDLLYLSSATAGAPLLVRVIGNRIPGDVAADLLVSPKVFALLGDHVFASR